MSQGVVARSQNLSPGPAAGEPGSGKMNRRRFFLFAAIAIMIVYFVPFLLLGKNSYITIHDNLDCWFVDNYLLVATGNALTFNGSAPIENVMNGLPRAAMPSGLNVIILLLYILPPAWAYIVNFVLVHAIAFCGMFLLLRKHFLTDDDDYFLAVAISICFFLVPYYTIHGLTEAGQPLLAYAFLNIRNGERNWKNYLVILLFPLWSVIAYVLPFVVTVLVLILVIDWIRSHRLNRHFLSSILLFTSAYIAVQYQLIKSILGSNKWVSHRIAWNRWTDFNLSSNMKRTVQMLFTTQYHTGSFYTLPIIVAAGGALVLLILKKRRAGLLDVLAIGIALICLEYGFYDWLVRWCGWLVPGSQAFNGSRFYFLLPLLWMLVFAMSLKELKRIKWSAPIIWCLIAFQAFAILKFNTEVEDSARLLAGKVVYEPSFSRFFAQDLFTEIDRFIGRPKSTYRVVSIGMYPSIAGFNGFYTVDSYQNNYPLSYKLQFRRIIAKELDKNAELRDYFDGWGNRCYVFSSELGMNSLCRGEDHYVLHNLQLDTGQLRAMGCEYAISAVEIENSEEHGLRLEKEFVSPGSFWHLYLYYVVPPVRAQAEDADPRRITGASRPQKRGGALPETVAMSRDAVTSGLVSGTGSAMPRRACDKRGF